MFRSILAATLTLALVLPAARPALANDAEDVAKIVGGLAALYILSQAIENRNDRRVRQAEPVRRAPTYTPSIQQRQRGNLYWDGRNWVQRPTIRQRQQGNLHWNGRNWVERPTIRQQNENRLHRDRHVRIIPEQCYREFDTRRGVVAGYGARCLQNRVARPGILPPQCIRQIRTDRGIRNLYGPRCLRQQGWSPRTARR